ncbi:MAG: hypothetical protein ACT4O2_00445, partial [Beijerinckiaceae bacterium]
PDGSTSTLRCRVSRIGPRQLAIQQCQQLALGRETQTSSPVPCDQGFAASNAIAGRILKSLVERGRVTPVPGLIRKAGRKTAPIARPHAIRKPKDVIFQIGTLAVALTPNLAVKHFDAYDIFAKWTVAKPFRVHG